MRMFTHTHTHIHTQLCYVHTVIYYTLPHTYHTTTFLIIVMMMSASRDAPWPRVTPMMNGLKHFKCIQMFASHFLNLNSAVFVCVSVCLCVVSESCMFCTSALWTLQGDKYMCALMVKSIISLCGAQFNLWEETPAARSWHLFHIQGISHVSSVCLPSTLSALFHYKCLLK